MLSRRELLKGMGIGSLAAGFPGLMFANAQTENRLVVFVLRGAMDGMAMLVPYGDGNYAGLRGKLYRMQIGKTALPSCKRGRPITAVWNVRFFYRHFFIIILTYF